MSALQILCVLVVATTLFSPCDLKRKPAFTLQQLLVSFSKSKLFTLFQILILFFMFYLNKDHCNAGESQYCWWAERDMGIPYVDFRRFYGPAESQCKFCGVVTVY